ncbi:MAG TPA: NHLP-related RiPP peptide [Xanthomonadaceae bacterium]|nr:NHLP-related RiPP peptide [Xanthomonadaceae bacterium]
MAGLDPKVADELLDKLSSDNAFRELFEDDPVAALASLGVHDWDSTDKLHVTRLADKQVIADARDQLRAALLAGLGNIPHKLES